MQLQVQFLHYVTINVAAYNCCPMQNYCHTLAMVCLSQVDAIVKISMNVNEMLLKGV